MIVYATKNVGSCVCVCNLTKLLYQCKFINYIIINEKREQSSGSFGGVPIPQGEITKQNTNDEISDHDSAV
jgi:hypothetical protein